MIKLAQTIEGTAWSTFDWNVFNDDGCIVDLGCLYWDWSKYWMGTKRVIGIDPFETSIPEGCELFTGVLGPLDCKVTMDIPNNNEVCGIVNYDTTNGNQFDMLSWKTFCEKFNINNVSILKINIEGSEYSFLDSLDKNDFSKINQIIVSFHDWLNPDWAELTKSSIKLLEKNGYTIISTYFEFGWYLCVKNNIIYNSDYPQQDLYLNVIR